VGSRFVTHPLGEVDRALLNDAIIALELAHGATLLAVIMQDGSGVFVNFLPGQEREIAGYLAKMSWKDVLRSVEEHSE